MPRSKKQWREFHCTCKSKIKKYMDNEHRWWAKVSKKYPYSVCRECNEERTAVDVNDGELVGVGSFACGECNKERTAVDVNEGELVGVGSFACDSTEEEEQKEYTVMCRGIDTAECYGCGEHISPYKVNPLGRIKRITKKEHSCSRCKDGKIYPCPNKSRPPPDS